MKKRAFAIGAAGVLLMAGVALAKPSLKPGSYEITMTMDFPGKPAGMAPMKMNHCMTEKELADLKNAIPAKESGCTMENVQQSNAKMSFNVTCDKNGHKASGSGEMTFKSESYEGQMVIESAGPDGKTMKMTMKYQAKRLGECAK